MISMRAKFSCQTVDSVSEGYRVTLVPVTSGSAENRDFFKYTPYGKIEIGTISRPLEIGRDYYVDFTPAPEFA